MVKMIAVLTYEYEANPSNYPEGATPQEMADIDNVPETADMVAELGTLTIRPA